MMHTSLNPTSLDVPKKSSIQQGCLTDEIPHIAVSYLGLQCQEIITNTENLLNMLLTEFSASCTHSTKLLLKLGCLYLNFIWSIILFSRKKI